MKAETIGEHVELSGSSVQRRLKRMREQGLVQAEVALVDPKIVGTSMTFIAGIEFERENYDALSKFRNWAESQDNIQQVYYVTGSVDLIVIMTAEGVDHYDAITARIMSLNPQIKKIETNVVLKKIKIGVFVPISA